MRSWTALLVSSFQYRFLCKGNLLIDASMNIGHYQLYKGSILHRDISINNLMFRWKQVENNRMPVGVLNDFDMAADLAAPHGPSGLERAGTPPYMALELLQGSEGTMKHLYRHDAESFVWVLLDLVSSYEEGGRKDDYPMQEWFRAETYFAMWQKKLAMLLNTQYQKQFTDAVLDVKLRGVIKKLLIELEEIYTKTEKWNKVVNVAEGEEDAVLPEHPYNNEDKVDEIYHLFSGIVRAALKCPDTHLPTTSECRVLW